MFVKEKENIESQNYNRQIHAFIKHGEEQFQYNISNIGNYYITIFVQ